MSTAKQPCPCGSGKPFRKCCGKAPSPAQRALHRQSMAPRLIALQDGRTLPPETVMEEAMTLHRAGRYRRAAELYRAVLTGAPQHADALHLLGVAERQAGRFDEAITLIKRALEIKPDVALFHNNLAETYRTLGKGPEAEAAARSALALDGRMVEAYLNLGIALHLQQQYPGALEAYQRALQLRPDYLDAQIGIGDSLMAGGNPLDALACYRSLFERHPDNRTIRVRIGMALRRAKRIDEAVEHYETCIRQQPEAPEYYNNLAHLYIQTGRTGEAAAMLRRFLELRPDDFSARHLLNGLEGKTTERAPAKYVQELFDGYAEAFESHLVEKLDYHMPELIGTVVRHLLQPGTRLDILDLGCGTGLMGEVLRDVAGRLVGVDISPKMVDKTRAKGIYAEAHADDLLNFMHRSTTGSFDLVVAADVFVYLGDLQAIFREAFRLLRPGGWFAFTVEGTHPTSESNDFVLDITGRYRHSDHYLQRLAREARLADTHFSREIIRTQYNQPVQGYLCLYTKPALPA